MNGKIVSQTRVVCLCKCSVITMGIKNLSKLLHDQAPAATSECTLKNLFGRKIAIDASTFLYSFLVAIRPDRFATPLLCLSLVACLISLFYLLLIALKY